MNSATENSQRPGVTAAQAWTCPFCSLLCDGFELERRGDTLALQGSECPRARAALATIDLARQSSPSIDGAVVTLEVALDAAAQRLRQSALPLFGGLATDVAGMRALYRLANVRGAIFDHARGDAIMHGLRALQDRGQIFTTLAEIRNRADLTVCIGTDAARNFPEFFRRCTAATPQSGPGRVVFVGAGKVEAVPGLEGHVVDCLTPAGDLFDAAAMLAALVAGKRIPVPDPELARLADDMRAARYCVVVWEPVRLPAQGALIAEAVLRIVTSLNRSTRAGAFALGGVDCGQTANAVLTWLSGLPLRTRVGPLGLDHEPIKYGGERLLADHAVDCVLWVASLTPDLPPPATDLPRVVLGHPVLAGMAARPGTVYIPVATPGIGASGHLFRADGVVALPLEQMCEQGYPGVAEVAAALTRRLAATAGEGAQ